MPNYNLLVLAEHKFLDAMAGNRNAAVANFGKQLGLELTLEDTGAAAQFMLDEWHGTGPHWVNPTIPVFVVDGS